MRESCCGNGNAHEIPFIEDDYGRERGAKHRKREREGEFVSEQSFSFIIHENGKSSEKVITEKIFDGILMNGKG